MQQKNLIPIENLVRPAGVGPTTFGFGGQRSIQLSYGRILFRIVDFGLRIMTVPGFLIRIPKSEIRNFTWYARQESNLRPADSKSDALSS
jgi:hypothetical protein